jgi:hypothetical protein
VVCTGMGIGGNLVGWEGIQKLKGERVEKEGERRERGEAELSTEGGGQGNGGMKGEERKDWEGSENKETREEGSRIGKREG